MFTCGPEPSPRLIPETETRPDGSNGHRQTGDSMQIGGGDGGVLGSSEVFQVFLFKLRAATITILKLFKLMTISGVDAMLILLCALGVRALGPQNGPENPNDPERHVKFSLLKDVIIAHVCSKMFDVLLVASVGDLQLVFRETVGDLQRHF